MKRRSEQQLPLLDVEEMQVKREQFLLYFGDDYRRLLRRKVAKRASCAFIPKVVK